VTEELPNIVQNALGENGASFAPRFPSGVLDRYDPGEGRFVSWHGSQGLAVNLQDRREDKPARLFLFHTPSNDEALGALVQKDLVRNFRVGGKIVPARLWREGDLTYVLFDGELSLSPKSR
jgi:hypothetical protein